MVISGSNSELGLPGQNQERTVFWDIACGSGLIRIRLLAERSHRWSVDLQKEVAPEQSRSFIWLLPKELTNTWKI